MDQVCIPNARRIALLTTVVVVVIICCCWCFIGSPSADTSTISAPNGLETKTSLVYGITIVLMIDFCLHVCLKWLETRAFLFTYAPHTQFLPTNSDQNQLKPFNSDVNNAFLAFVCMLTHFIEFNRYVTFFTSLMASCYSAYRAANIPCTAEFCNTRPLKMTIGL